MVTYICKGIVHSSRYWYILKRGLSKGLLPWLQNQMKEVEGFGLRRLTEGIFVVKHG